MCGVAHRNTVYQTRVPTSQPREPRDIDKNRNRTKKTTQTEPIITDELRVRDSAHFVFDDLERACPTKQ